MISARGVRQEAKFPLAAGSGNAVVESRIPLEELATSHILVRRPGRESGRRCHHKKSNVVIKSLTQKTTFE